eukprot:TRINITY_DN5998_c1_g1_i1.p1 TRINITY_DN5998_c1_g1~~TRINITY_DN5998_c1_g1_i1.p1  ORF type:complete len:215 (+),score=53.17 TRINITY_DN5998_c1_g1_i1:46-645(+)
MQRNEYRDVTGSTLAWGVDTQKKKKPLANRVQLRSEEKTAVKGKKTVRAASSGPGERAVQKKKVAKRVHTEVAVCVLQDENAIPVQKKRHFTEESSGSGTTGLTNYGHKENNIAAKTNPFHERVLKEGFPVKRNRSLTPRAGRRPAMQEIHNKPPPAAKGTGLRHVDHRADHNPFNGAMAPKPRSASTSAATRSRAVMI